MRFIIVTIGTEGDVRPYIALARELKLNNHEVSIATSENHFNLINNFAIECIPIKFKGCAKRPTSLFGFRFVRSIKSSIVNEEGYLSALWSVCQKADAIIYNVATFPCLYIAEKLGIPSFGAFMQPHHPTKDFPDPSVTNGKPLGGVFNLAGFWLFDFLHWIYVRKSINKWRKETLRLPEIPLSDTILKQMRQRECRILYAYSPSLVPKPAEWRSDRLQVTGYWYLDTVKDYSPSPELDFFLNSGPPPVFISTMWNVDKFSKEKITKIGDLSNVRLIIHDLHGEMEEIHSTEWIFYIKGPIPHEWLFKRVAAAVHHGGLGISMNCIRAGVPMITIPADTDGNDHRFWAYQLSKSNVGVYVDADNGNGQFISRLSLAIKTAISSNDIKQHSLALSKKISAETGLQNAIRFITNEVAGLT